MMNPGFLDRSQLEYRVPAELPSGLGLCSKGDATDHQLVCCAQSGDISAFNKLVQRYRSRVLKLTTRYVRNHADAEDLVQETFFKAYGALKHFRGDCAFYSWLHRIAINAANTAIAARSRDTSLFLAGTAGHDVSDDGEMRARNLDTPEDIAVSDEICSAVNAAIDSLCDEQRRAIILREFNGLNYRQVAVAMSCPVGTVRSRIFRAREAIDEQVRKSFDDGLGRKRPRRGTNGSKPAEEILPA